MIDSHCHLNDKKLLVNIDKILKDAKEKGVKKFLVVGYDLISSLKAVELSERYSEIYAAVGIHPSDVKKAKKEDYKILETLLTKPKVIAVGEIGLDYYWEKDKTLQEQQKEYFIKQIHLANKYQKPIVVHMREASLDTLQTLQKERPTYGGIMHCYSGSAELAHDFMEVGLFISLAGPVTFLNAKTPKEVAKVVPLNKLLIETDAPYLSPHPLRGKLNEPKNLPLIAEEIARLKNTNAKTIIEQTTKNFLKLFKIDEEKN